MVVNKHRNRPPLNFTAKGFVLMLSHRAALTKYITLVGHSRQTIILFILFHGRRLTG